MLDSLKIHISQAIANLQPKQQGPGITMEQKFHENHSVMNAFSWENFHGNFIYSQGFC